MQTFLPFKSFELSAQSLDYKRLGKQRVEAMQILKIVSGETPNARWRNHPAVKMWIGYHDCLVYYHNVMINEWIKRGYNNTMQFKVPFGIETDTPWWLGNEDMHRSHRSRLIEKNPIFYIPRFPDDIGFNDAKYFWPDNETKRFKII